MQRFFMVHFPLGEKIRWKKTQKKNPNPSSFWELNARDYRKEGGFAHYGSAKTLPNVYNLPAVQFEHVLCSMIIVTYP